MRYWILLPTAACGLACGLLLDDGWFRVLLAVATVWVFYRYRDRSSQRRHRRAHRATILVVLATLSAAQATGPELWKFASSSWVRVWNVYHYYLGSKYFAELGYHDLYAATLAADRDGYWDKIKRVRDLESYELQPRTAIRDRYHPRDHFSDERWQAFEKDVAALRGHRPPDRWQGIFRDRGYNPPPTWTALGGVLARLDASNLLALKALCSLDLVILGLTFLLIKRTFGLEAFALTLLLFTMSPVNEGRIVGGFLQFDWFAAIGVGLCQLRRGRPVTAGLAFAYAAATRVFPAILLIAAAVPVIVRWIQRGRFAPSSLRLAFAIATFGLLFFLLGTFGGGGIDAWSAFADNIEHHNSEHRFGQQRVGLAHLFTHDIRSLAFDENFEERRELFRRQSDLFHLLGVSLLVGWFLAVRRRNLSEAFLLGLVPLFVLTVSSRYYWGCLAFLPMLESYGALGHRQFRWLTAGQVALFGAAGLYGLWRHEAFAQYSMLGLLLGVFLVSWMVLYLLRELRARRRTIPL